MLLLHDIIILLNENNIKIEVLKKKLLNLLNNNYDMTEFILKTQITILFELIKSSLLSAFSGSPEHWSSFENIVLNCKSYIFII